MVVKKSKEQEQKDPNTGNDESYGVMYVPLRCPSCKSKSIKCYTSSPPVRYHRCRQCGVRFKSVEG